MFMVLSSWQSHCESSPGSFDKMYNGAKRPPTQDQAIRLRLWVCLYRLPESRVFYFFRRFYASAVCAATYISLSVPVYVPWHQYILSLCRNTGRISMKRAGGNHDHHATDKMITFWAKLEQRRIWQNILIDASRCVAEMSNRCWRLANEFTNFSVYDLLAAGTPVRKTFTTDVGQMQQRRHHMTVHGL